MDAEGQRKTRKLPKSVRPEEFKRMIMKTPRKDKEARTAFLLAYGSGLRISEALAVRQQDIKPDSIFITSSKYDRERVVPLPKGWKEEFTKLLPLKFGNSNNKLAIRRNLQRKFRRYAALAKLSKEYTFHSLRHGFATRCLESGVPINQVQLLLGHSNISTTNVYVKANPIDALKNYAELF